MLYIAYYKNVGASQWFRIKNVKGDGLVEGANMRFFILDDESRIEISTINMMFRFDSKRFLMIKKQMELQAGQSIPTNDGAS